MVTARVQREAEWWKAKAVGREELRGVRRRERRNEVGTWSE